MTDARTDEADESTPALTEYAELHGCSCKVGQGDLEALLTDVGLAESRDELMFGVGEDASARVLSNDLALVTTIDFFTPIVDDPYEFGRVAACNAASDAFATGAADDLSVHVVLGLPREVTDVAADVLAGIADAVDGMGGIVAGGHTILNPWPIAGGAVTATAAPESLLATGNAEPSDRLFLTKPLGTQPAMGAARVRDGEFAETVGEAATRPIETIVDEALEWMTMPNRAAMVAGREFATAATDVTGFGLRGQAEVLAANADVGVELTRLPVIEGTVDLSRLFGYGLGEGASAETSGGLLFAVPDDRAGAFEAAMADADVFCRPVGRVTDGSDVTLCEPTVEPVSR